MDCRGCRPGGGRTRAGGSFGRRAYEWQFYDGLGRLIQTQADFDRGGVLVRAQDVNDVRQAILNGGGSVGFGAVTTGVDRVQASHFAGLRSGIQGLWAGATPSLGPLPDWSSGLAPGGPSLGTAATPIYGSDVADLRAWLNGYQTNRQVTVSTWGATAGTVVVVNRVYDSRGLLQKETVPHLLTLNVPGGFQSADWGSATTPATTYGYDALKRPTVRTNPDGTHADTSYPGWATATVDERLHKKVRTNDGLGRLAKVQEYSGESEPRALYSTTTYEYNVADQLTRVTDTAGNVTTIHYDNLGRKDSQTDPDLGAWQYGYDPVGTLATQTDAKSQTLSFFYDALKRLTQRKQGTTVLAEFVYDEVTGGFAGYSGKGRRTTTKFPAGLGQQVRTYYDGRGRVVREEHVLDTTYTVTRTYDDQDRPLTVTLPNGEVLTYRYGDHGRPVSLESSLKGTIVGAATYNALGKPYDQTLGNGLVTSYRYWGIDTPGTPTYRYGRLWTLVAGARQSLTYDYDPAGNVASVVDGRTNETVTLTYDHLDRLTRAYTTPAGFDESYSYTAVGNFVSKAGVSYGYPPVGGRPAHGPTSVGGNSYTYDLNGNLTGAEGRTYSYDVENRLSGVSGAGLPTLGFEYDGDGALRKTTENAAVRLRYVTAEYQVDGGGQWTVYYRFAGRVVAWRNGSVVRYLLADQLASVQGEVGTDQSEVGQRRYLPFGGDRAVSGANDLTRDERYTGQRRVEAGGGAVNDRKELYHYNARAYLPGVGVFAQPDTAAAGYANPQTLNRYAYCTNNPLRYSDPTGHYEEEDDPSAWVPSEEGPTDGDSGPDTSDGIIRFEAGIGEVGGQDTELTSMLGTIAAGLDSADLALTSTAAAATLVATVVAGPLGLAAGEAVYQGVSVVTTAMDVAGFGLVATADILAGRTAIAVEQRSVEIRVGIDTAVSGGTLAGGLVIRDVFLSTAVDALQVGYDTDRAHGAPARSAWLRDGF